MDLIESPLLMIKRVILYAKVFIAAAVVPLTFLGVFVGWLDPGILVLLFIMSFVMGDTSFRNERYLHFLAVNEWARLADVRNRKVMRIGKLLSVPGVLLYLGGRFAVLNDGPLWLIVVGLAGLLLAMIGLVLIVISFWKTSAISRLDITLRP